MTRQNTECLKTADDIEIVGNAARASARKKEADEPEPVSALVVGVVNERFAIPQLDVAELVMITANGQSRIETLNDSPIYRLRGNILPLVCLRELLGFPALADADAQYIAVLNVGAWSFGLIVDRVFEAEEVIVTDLPQLLSNIPVFSGNTILRDNHVSLVLSAAGILKAKCIVRDIDIDQQNAAARTEIAAEPETSILLFETADHSVKAIPLSQVIRLEEVEMTAIETANGKRVMQYRERLMPLYLGSPHLHLPESGKRPVIVFSGFDGPAGLLVERIYDITALRGEHDTNDENTAVSSAIINGKATDILNLKTRSIGGVLS